MIRLKAELLARVNAILLVIAAWPCSAFAQQNPPVHVEHSGPEAESAAPAGEDATEQITGLMEAMRPGGAGGWYSSGTSQVPLATPTPMLHQSLGPWGIMLQGVLSGVWTNQTGPRGRDKIYAPNWIMPMASRRLGPGRITVRSMLSLEPLTITGKRYPLIFQTGELANGIPIINGQHPHDFFMELGVSYQQQFSERAALNFFAGPRGEPTLGPPAFPHRASASENPTAAIAHHYQDSTHISSTVVSAGFTYGPFTLEALGFHGREPDEHRWGLEQGPIDSFAARITVTPTPRWAMQFSSGRINSREQTHVLRDSLRRSASISYARPLPGGHWVTTVIWGRNHDLPFTQLPQSLTISNAPVFTPLTAGEELGLIQRYHIVSVPTPVPGYIYNSYLAESTLLLGRKHWVWTRVENTDRDSYLLYEEAPFVLFTDEQRYTRVQTYTFGYERELPSPHRWISSGLGAQMMVYGVPENLEPIYGQRPVGLQMFLRLRLGSYGN